MFKKNRNALLEEMRAIARQETGEVFERLSEAGVLSEVTAVVGFDGQRFVSYGTRLVTEAKAREIANEEIDRAFEQQASAHKELESGTGAEMRDVLKVWKLAAEAERIAELAQATADGKAGGGVGAAPEVTLYSGGGFVQGRLFGGFEHKGGTEGGRRRDEEHDARRAPIFARVDGVVCAVAALNTFRDLIECALDELGSSMNGGAVAGKTADQNSSPVVAESEAVTSDAPAMTVQENTGAGAVSPSAPAQPRFVKLGASVYDRENDLFFVATNAAVAGLSVAELNNSPELADGYKWEDAK